MSKYFRMATMAYLVLLGVMLGAGLFAGVVVAPVTFNTVSWLGSEVLTHYQEGQIMTENFVRLSYLVNFVVVAVILYEGYKYKKFERDWITQAATFFVVATGMLFAHYYLPDIITMQQAGETATQSQTFINTHKGSELNFKLFSLALLVLMIRNMQKACK
ncbi:DUF4149 domain-containing protein [Sulfurovum sp. zt1-1]|uniref:DUF4149 domain-containing protein n=1 Tax=Sulfurovum zhangzhouensis TaxID=3019067 RepID=A0ABT7QYW0_9BACT|nr:DUF4149 domain-containing protein [Sulfurovum zhangzhouensis]MDM5272028.1 DUF4149 domain-containing protein [Sulfurovum zhangzhouensis]